MFVYNLNYNQLYYFFIVASLGSVKEACKKLHLTQPSISGGIKNLEQSLGVKLFNREYRKLTLNENGKTVYEKAKSIFDLGEELLDELRISKDICKNTTDSINIGISFNVPKTIGQRLLSPFWKGLAAKVNITHGNHTRLYSAFENKSIDILITDQSPKDHFNITSSMILSSRYVLVGHKKLAYLKDNFPQSISNIPTILLADNTTKHETIQQIYENFNIKLNVIGKFDDVNTIVETLKCGSCIALIDEVSFKNYKNEWLTLITTLPFVKLKIWALTSNLTPHFSINRSIYNELVKNLKELDSFQINIGKNLNTFSSSNSKILKKPILKISNKNHYTTNTTPHNNIQAGISNQGLDWRKNATN